MQRGSAKLPLDQDGFTMIPRRRARVPSAVPSSHVLVECPSSSSVVACTTGASSSFVGEKPTTVGSSAPRRRKRRGNHRLRVVPGHSTAADSSAAVTLSGDPLSRRTQRVLEEVARERRALVYAQYLSQFMPQLEQSIQRLTSSCEHCCVDSSHAASSSAVAALPSSSSSSVSSSSSSSYVSSSSSTSSVSSASSCVCKCEQDATSSTSVPKGGTPTPLLERVICAGLGSFASSHQATVQLALLQLIMEQLPAPSEGLHIYEPLLDADELSALSSWSAELSYPVQVHPILLELEQSSPPCWHSNSPAKEQQQEQTPPSLDIDPANTPATSPSTLLYVLPHCPLAFLDRLLSIHKHHEQYPLRKVILLGNSLETYDLRLMTTQDREKATHVLECIEVSTEHPLPPYKASPGAFNDLAVVSFDV